MRGMGELHLDILVDRMKREFKVEANIGAPQVAYRETIGHEVEHSYTHKKQSGGSGQFGEVKLLISPTEPGEGYSFESRVVGGSVPKEYIPGVEKGINSVMDSGPLAGFPVIDFKVACSTVSSTMLTPLCWRSKSQLVWVCAKACAKRVRNCSSRS